MATTPATMAALLFGFRTNQTIAAPVPATTDGHFRNGKYRVLWSLPVRGKKKGPSFPGGLEGCYLGKLQRWHQIIQLFDTKHADVTYAILKPR